MAHTAPDSGTAVQSRAEVVHGRIAGVDFRHRPSVLLDNFDFFALQQIVNLFLVKPPSASDLEAGNLAFIGILIDGYLGKLQIFSQFLGSQYFTHKSLLNKNSSCLFTRVKIH
jgi:hypothetical protein